MIPMPRLLPCLARLPLPNEATRKVLTAICISAEGSDVPLCPLKTEEIALASGVPSFLAEKALRWLESNSIVEPDCDPSDGDYLYWLDWERISVLSSSWDKYPALEV